MALNREGKERSFRENLVLASTLPAVAGMVNVLGYMHLGFFTSHMTGRVSGFGVDFAKGMYIEGTHLLELLAAFIFGAILAASLVEIAKVVHWPRYQLPLLVEALLLSTVLLFEVLSDVPVVKLPESTRTVFAMVFAMSMGLQNALVARLSGAVIRTTHLTGLSTDLGVELVRLFRWFMEETKGQTLGQRLRHIGVVRKDGQLYKVRLYVTILCTFISGCIMGGLLSKKVGVLGMVAPVLVLVSLVLYDRFLWVSEEDLEPDFNPAYPQKPEAAAPAPAPAPETAPAK